MYVDTMWDDFATFCSRFEALNRAAKDKLCVEMLDERYSALPRFRRNQQAMIFEGLMSGNFDEDSVRYIFATGV